MYTCIHVYIYIYIYIYIERERDAHVVLEVPAVSARSRRGRGRGRRGGLERGQRLRAQPFCCVFASFAAFVAFLLFDSLFIVAPPGAQPRADEVQVEGDDGRAAGEVDALLQPAGAPRVTVGDHDALAVGVGLAGRLGRRSAVRRFCCRFYRMIKYVGCLVLFFIRQISLSSVRRPNTARTGVRPLEDTPSKRTPPL